MSAHPTIPSSSACIELSAALLAWFAQHRRELPWRREYRPYHVLVSEIMLQQTQMERVVPYFRRFIERFPDPAALAAADEETLLKTWEGLGYYSRARNLQRAAQALVVRHGGTVPDDHAALLALPGVGPYTAGAVMSLAFNRPHPAVDANVERVFARLFNLDKPVKDKATRAVIEAKARELLPAGQARDFNQALMELGALVCAPRAPRCAACPVTPWCVSRRLGVEGERPVPAPAKAVTPLAWGVGLLIAEGRLLLRKRPQGVIMGGLWELPGAVTEPGESLESAVCRAFREDFSLSVAVGELVGAARHGFTRFDCRLSAYLCSPLLALPAAPLSPSFAAEIRWASLAEASALACGAGMKRLLQTLARDLRLSGLLGG